MQHAWRDVKRANPPLTGALMVTRDSDVYRLCGYTPEEEHFCDEFDARGTVWERGQTELAVNLKSRAEAQKACLANPANHGG